MYSHFSIDQTGRDDYDTDIALEYEDKERYQDFENFYWDVLPEFKKFGKVVQFKVCSNHEPHLRGNVYVQYSKEEEAVEAYKNFNGRYYAGKQITCEFTHVIKWRSAICGLYERHLCPKGINCNFLHVFRNPSNEFWEADRDLPGRPKDRISVSSRSNHSRSKEERTHSYRGHRSERHRHHRDQSPEQNNDRYSKSSSYRYDRASDSDDYEDDHYGSSRHRYSDRNGDSYRSRHQSSKNRNSRSRSRSLSYSSEEDEKYKAQRKRKHKKKKSKK
ncbi:U2 small nuclear ribonucleoprotein auxiliary factor subunit-related protein 1, partial [Stegodyphus mimosarum]